MSITVAVSGRSPISTNEPQITIGSHPSCVIAFPGLADVKSIHAIIHEVQGRWMIEPCQGEVQVVGKEKLDRGCELMPGDVIMLSPDCPELTFEPEDDSFLPDSSTQDEDEFRLVPLEDAPKSSGTIPARRSPSSATIPTTDAPSAGKSSDKVRVPQSPSSGAIPVKPRSSGTIRAVGLDRESSGKAAGESKSRQSDQNIPARKSNSNLPARKSDPSLPASGAKRSRSSGQIPVHKQPDDEGIATGMVLTRTNSWDIASDDDDLPLAPRSRRSSNDAEMKWIMMVVGRSAGGGLALLVMWLTISTIWKSLGNAPAGLPEAGSASVADISPAAVANVAPYVPPRTTTPANAVTKGTVPKDAGQTNTTSPAMVKPPAQSETTTTETKVVTNKDPATPQDSGADQGNVDGESSSELLARIGADSERTTIEPVEGEAAEEVEAEEGSLSPLQLATMDSIYAVMVEDPTNQRKRQVGTAWAASPRHLVTSATVARIVEESRQQSRVVYALHPTSERKVQIASVRMHNHYRQAARLVDEAIEKNNEKKQVQFQKAQVRFDIAVMNVSPADKLESFLEVAVAPLKNSKEAVFSMVGLPFQKPDKVAAVPPSVLRERHSLRPSWNSPLQAKDSSLNIQFPWHEKDPNWAGSPVINAQNQVIGVYAQLPASKTAESRKGRPEAVVVWVGLLREFAQDAVKSVSIDDEF
ncbi:FHA domain-containing protein [Schlesneria sp. DSM 10557]|uniref:FHA domain-containing protein n=1 Tax=Schlesneria sp. DSM 10557 TaxID=3044399 RepID=UPI00359F41AB